mmetsp:Transcript_1527/g.4183  ORF Transcript_1527/g.4183 Transcript_1527/m.4183 type:complete len:93 (-) Transcript_1527:323-601(-)
MRPIDLARPNAAVRRGAHHPPPLAVAEEETFGNQVDERGVRWRSKEAPASVKREHPDVVRHAGGVHGHALPEQAGLHVDRNLNLRLAGDLGG